ncbi:hypothetical protein PoB_001180100 [Plakobranchus ocellatus]|uniref:Uncharacterized protein n=1 Tax=Plakobranchus ocellatus TaxID=259542 RepID=A0AAV3YD97_9GAST|nr:hypothetical protein PoB_001180100 [Plakobranchus ocellatus]
MEANLIRQSMQVFGRVSKLLSTEPLTATENLYTHNKRQGCKERQSSLLTVKGKQLMVVAVVMMMTTTTKTMMTVKVDDYDVDDDDGDDDSDGDDDNNDDEDMITTMTMMLMITVLATLLRSVLS